MPRIDLITSAAQLPKAWKSEMMSRLGSAQIKVLRMDGSGLAEEQHPYTEALLVLEGLCNLVIDQELIPLKQGEIYIVPAGLAHSVATGSQGCLLIIDEPDSLTAAVSPAPPHSS